MFRQNDNNVHAVEYIISPNLFEAPNLLILIEVPFCPKNETSSKQFTKKFQYFRSDTLGVKIYRLTRKMRTLFQLKCKSLHSSCKMYERICGCRESDVIETIRNVETRQSEHNAPHDK